MARLTVAAAAALLLGLAAPPVGAQVPATNDVAACGLLADPTAQRSCIESARQRRAAPAFDPSAVHLRGAERRARADGIPGVRRALGGKRARAATRRDGRAAAASGADAPNEMP